MTYDEIDNALDRNCTGDLRAEVERLRAELDDWYTIWPAIRVRRSRR